MDRGGEKEEWTEGSGTGVGNKERRTPPIPYRAAPRAGKGTLNATWGPSGKKHNLPKNRDLLRRDGEGTVRGNTRVQILMNKVTVAWEKKRGGKPETSDWSMILTEEMERREEGKIAPIMRASAIVPLSGKENRTSPLRKTGEK